MSDGLVHTLGADTDDTLEMPEWWRIVEVVPPRGARLIFIEQGAAEDFANYLVDDAAGQVLVEHWRDGELNTARLIVRFDPN